MKLLSQIGISPKLPHPPGPGVPQALEATGAEVPDAATYSLEEAVGTRHQAGTKAAVFYGVPASPYHLREP